MEEQDTTLANAQAPLKARAREKETKAKEALEKEVNLTAKEKVLTEKADNHMAGSLMGEHGGEKDIKEKADTKESVSTARKLDTRQQNAPRQKSWQQWTNNRETLGEWNGTSVL